MVASSARNACYASSDTTWPGKESADARKLPPAYECRSDEENWLMFMVACAQ